MPDNGTIYLVSSSVYELAWFSKLPVEALARLDFLATEDKDLALPSASSSGLATTDRLVTSSEAPKLMTPIRLILDSLLRQQHADGCWGSAAFSLGDRLINTLAALSALAYNRHRWRQFYSSLSGYHFPSYYQTSLELGLTWLNTQPDLASYDPKDDLADLAGLELIVPALKLELAQMGIVPQSSASEDKVLRKARAKLGMVPPGLIFQPGSTLSHALEFTGTLLNPSSAQLAGAVSPNGSVGNSPSATAFVLQSAWDELAESVRSQMLSYLERAANATFFWRSERPYVAGNGTGLLSSEVAGFSGLGWPVTWPVNHFLSIWYNYYQNKAGTAASGGSYNGADAFALPVMAGTVSQSEDLRSAALESGRTRTPLVSSRRNITAYLGEQLKHSIHGFGADEHFAVDADTTSTYISVMAEELVHSGQIVWLDELVKVLLDFFDKHKGYFLTYPFEMTGSLTTNSHAWEALNKIIELFPQFGSESSLKLNHLVDLRNQVAAYIRIRANDRTYWRDKWHMSPVYATYHVAASGMLRLEEDGPQWQTRIIKWLLANQSTVDGGWGFVALQDHTEFRGGTKQDKAGQSNVDETFHALRLLYQLHQEWLRCSESTTYFSSDKALESQERERLNSSIITAIQRGAICLEMLIHTQPSYTWPAMWCDKTLYCPYGMLFNLSKELLGQVNQQYDLNEIYSYEPEPGIYSLNTLAASARDSFDRITRTARRLFNAPIAFISLLSEAGARPRFNPALSLDAVESVPDLLLWEPAMLEPGTLAIGNALLDGRFADNPLVTGKPAIRAYIGQALFDRDGLRVGTLGIFDYAPRQIAESDLQSLQDLATWAESELNVLRQSQVEKTLREVEQRLYTVVNNSPIILFSLDNQGVHTLLEGKGLETLGLKPGQLVGLSVFELNQNDPAILDETRRVLRGETVTSLAEAGGAIFERWASPIRDKDGNVTGAIGVATNITERKKAEKALRDSEQRYRSVVNSIKEVIFQTDAHGNWTFLNPAWEEITGFSVEESLGKSFLSYIYPPDRKLNAELFTPLLEGQVDFSRFEIRYLTGAGDYKWFEVIARLTLDESGTIVGTSGVLRDVTERRKIDRLKNEFISTVSHELRTPLTSIRGSLGLIAGGAVGEITPQAKNLLDIANRNADQLTRLINDILDIEKIESDRLAFELSSFDLGLLVAQAVEANRTYAAQFGIEFKLEQPLPTAKVRADSGRIMQVLANLLSNAAKFSPRGSVVKVNVTRHNCNIRVAITDQGVGIPEEFQDRVFEKFAQADGSATRKQGGSGLGLSISKAIVEKHGGKIGYEANSDGGTTFYFDLPMLTN